MCGICGQYNFRHVEPIDPGTIHRMTGTIVHRGPDDEGYYFSGSLGLGFRRLSIIDLEGGHQPMPDRERSVWVVFNGEIYNFPELKRELEGYGHVFQTRCDTEVIIHGYKEWGEEVFNHLNGMFGLAIWDERKKKLILARDAMGIKFVYYRIGEGRVTFGSEIRPILIAMEEKPSIDPAALNLFLRYSYTPSPYTLFEGIRKLAPGTMLIAENGKTREERWYKFRPTPFVSLKNDEEAAEELLAIYKRALKRHLLSDVPLGLLLSGGVDSGLLLGLMSLYGSSWRTFTIGYGKSFQEDELEDAARTARIYDSRHSSVELPPQYYEDHLSRVISCLEEPVETSSIVLMDLICARAREDVKVALVGQGPDELFGGYVRHLGVRYGEIWRKSPEWIKKPIEGIIGFLPRNEALKRGTASLGIRDRLPRYQNVFSMMPGEVIDGLFRDDLLPPGSGDRILECWNGLDELMDQTDELGGFQFLEVRSSLPDKLLMYADKLSMAHSLEVRVPFLDREIVEFVERLPARFKVRFGSRKWLHRKVCRQFLPSEILRRKKRGFSTDAVDGWLRSGNAKMEDLFRDSQSLMYGFLMPDRIGKLFAEHRSGKQDNHKLLFSLVVFEEWLRSFHTPTPLTL